MAPVGNSTLTSRSASCVPYLTVTCSRTTERSERSERSERFTTFRVDRLLELALARHAGIVRVREDGPRHPFRIPAALQLFAAAERVVGGRLVTLVIEVVQERDHPPRLLVFTEHARVAAHRRFDGE